MLYWIWLTQIKGVGPKRQRVLLDRFGSPENIYKANLADILECNGIGNKTGKAIIEQRCMEKSRVILENVEELNIKLLTLDSNLYPDKAKDILEMPILLYYKGDLIENSMGVGIVGARRCTDYGKKEDDFLWLMRDHKGTGYHPNFVETYRTNKQTRCVTGIKTCDGFFYFCISENAVEVMK